MKKIIVITLLALSLSSCYSAEDQRKRDAYKAYEMQMNAIDKVYGR